MFYILLIIIYLSAKNLAQSMESIKGDRRHIEVRLILDVHFDEADPKKLKAVFISRSLVEGIQLFQHPEYNKDLPSVILIHGFHGSADKHNPHLFSFIRNEYRQRYNIFALNMPLYFDWSPGNLWYLLPAMRAKFGGEAVGELLNQAIDEGLLTADQINLIGFSLGAQMSGYIARTVRGEVYSILGLDPAGPGFDTKVVQYNLMMTHVSKTDARHVHMYHTNSNTFGSTQRVATADFIFNNGWHQPGCMISILIMCSHRRACHLFTSTLNSPHLFEAIKCGSYWDFKHCRCRDNQVVRLAFPPDPSANGTYYIMTSAQAPFGEGELGSMCPKDRLIKLIEDGVVKPAPSFYDTLKKLRPTVLFWGKSAVKENNSAGQGSEDSSPATVLKVSPVSVPMAINGDVIKDDDGEIVLSVDKDITAATIIENTFL